MTRKRKRPPSRSRPMLAAVTATSQMRRLVRECPDAHPEIWARWPAIAGELIGRRTFPLRYQNGILSIGVSSSTWLQQISFLRENLINRIDEEIGPGVVTEIRLVLDTTGVINAPNPRSAPAHRTIRTSAVVIPPHVRSIVAAIEDPELADALARAIATSQEIPDK